MGRTTHLQLIFTISCFFCLHWISGLASIPNKYSLGIDPKDEAYYKSSAIQCKDGSKKFSREQLNDEFCDCPDGTDEPGTSACPEGRFYCQNVGHSPLTIFSSRVNDGICDCCDGSDEYDGKVTCQNTCWDAGKTAREKLNKKIKTYQEGVTVRKKEVEKAKQAFATDEEDLSKLKSKEKILKDLVDKLKDQKERIEKEEERLKEAVKQEQLKKEKEEKKLKEAEEKAKEQEELSDKVSHDPAAGVHEELAHQDKPAEVHLVHDAASESEKDHNIQRLSADHASDQDKPGKVQEVHDSAGESEKDHDVKKELPADHAVDQYVPEDEDVDDTYKPDTADQSRNDKEAPRDVANQEQGGSDDTSGLSKEELGRLVASRWTGESATHKTNEAGSTVKNEVQADIADSVEEDDTGYTSETEDDRPTYNDGDFADDLDDEYENDNVESDDHVDSDGLYKHDNDDDFSGGKSDDDFSDLTDSSSSSWLNKLKLTVHNVLSSFNFFRTPVDLSEADRVRKEYDDSKSKLSKIESRISSLTEKLKHDFGKDKEFYSFYDRCFENKQNKYVYKVCPFKQASQVEGHSTTRLGRWDKFDESYRIMLFSNGDKCWNGPDRSMKVRLRCGLKDELTDVDEPSRCEYVALLSTPLLCVEDKLKELEGKLDQMNTRQHDEL